MSSPARGQGQTLVGNLNGRVHIPSNVGTGTRAQGFTTGGNAAGYSLSSVDLDLTHARFSDLVVTIRSGTTSTGPSLDASDDVYTLTNPAVFANPGIYTFAAPAGAELRADTTYFVFARRVSGGGNVAGWNRTWQSAADEAAPGWSIQFGRWDFIFGHLSQGPLSVKMRVNGVALDRPVVRVEADSAYVVEGASAAFTVTADPAPTKALEVSLSVVAEGQFGYGANVGDRTVTVPAGKTTAAYTLTTTGDGADVAHGAVAASLARDAAYTIASSPGDAATVRVLDDDGNDPPIFVAAATAFEVAENATAVTTVAAVDPDSGDSVPGYALSGADEARFAIDGAGALTFRQAPDHENPLDAVSATPSNESGNNEYVVTVTARGGTGGRELTAETTLTVTVTDEDEPPGKPGAPAVAPRARATDALTVTWTAPDNAGRPAIEHYHLRYRREGGSDWTPGPRASGSPGEIGGLTVAARYEVQVRADNAEGEGEWSDSGTGAILAVVAVAADAPSVVEGSSARFTVSASPTLASDLDVNVTIAATGDFGYSGAVGAGTVTISAAQGTAVVAVGTSGDGADEPNGTVMATLEAGAGYSVGSPATASVTVLDDDDSRGGGGGGGGGPPPGDEDDDPPPDGDSGGGGGPPRAAIATDAECADGLCRARTGIPARFEDASSGLVRFRRWDFGDGGRRTSPVVDHAWPKPGFHEVTLWTSDGSAESTASLAFLVEAAEPAGTCEAGAGRRCLRDSRHAVSVEWRTASGESGDGIVVWAGTNESALFRFFDPANWEVLVKVLDGCAVNGHVWVFTASTTDLGYTIRVVDTATGAAKEYRNEPGQPATAVADTKAFPGGCRP